MRIAGIVAMMVGAVAGAAGVAGADDERQARPQPRVNVAVMFAMGAWDVGPLTFGANGADVELAAGVGARGQLALEGFVARLDDEESDVGGRHARVGVTGRWFPRSFHPDHLGAIDMYLEGGTGLQRTWWDGGGRLTRQDVTLGTGMQIRFRAAGQIGMRCGVQFLWAEPLPLAQLERAVCKGTCPDGGHAAPLDVAFMGQFGLSWGR